MIVADATRFECRVCWHVYDPEEGDVQAQIPPGTAFSDLPENWCCPRCDGAKSGFLPCSEG
ncbi:rubredoxin [Methylocaldum sp. BRCS4]|nr:rubredoxin [Methylocaldum sp. BRCS4]